MPGPTRSAIKKRVVHNLSILSGYSESSIKQEHKLGRPDLWLSESARGELAPGFQAIAREDDPEARVTKTECKKLKKVKNCVDLVWKRAGGS